MIVLVIILSKLSFIHAGDNFIRTSPLFLSSPVITYKFGLNYTRQLKYLAGKKIYRDVPVKNETEFSKEYMNEPYELFSYNIAIMELKNSNRKSIILERNLWDDGNWKEWNAIERIEARVESNVYNFKVGDKVKTNKEYNRNFKAHITGEIVNIWTGIISNTVVILDNGKILDTTWLEKDNEIFIGTIMIGNVRSDDGWYVGMEVCDILEGRGIVVKVSRNSDEWYPVEVKLDRKRSLTINDTYTLGGVHLIGQVRRLYPAEVQSVVFDFDKLFPKKIK